MFVASILVVVIVNTVIKSLKQLSVENDFSDQSENQRTTYSDILKLWAILILSYILSLTVESYITWIPFYSSVKFTLLFFLLFPELRLVNATFDGFVSPLYLYAQNRFQKEKIQSMSDLSYYILLHALAIFFPHILESQIKTNPGLYISSITNFEALDQLNFNEQSESLKTPTRDSASTAPTITDGIQGSKLRNKLSMLTPLVKKLRSAGKSLNESACESPNVTPTPANTKYFSSTFDARTPKLFKLLTSMSPKFLKSRLTSTDNAESASSVESSSSSYSTNEFSSKHQVLVTNRKTLGHTLPDSSMRHRPSKSSLQTSANNSVNAASSSGSSRVRAADSSTNPATTRRATPTNAETTNVAGSRSSAGSPTKVTGARSRRASPSTTPFIPGSSVASDSATSSTVLQQKPTRPKSPFSNSAKITSITAICPGSKIPIRAQPDINSDIIKYLASGDMFQTSSEILGFFVLVDNQGYVNRATKGVEWREMQH